MNLRGLWLLVICCLVVPGAPLADEPLQFFYSRDSLTLMRNRVPLVPPSLPWLASTPDNPAVTLDVEIRDATTIYNQEGWYNFSAPSEKGGVLLAFSEPGTAPIVRATEYAPLDILLIDSEGRITQILPSLKLSELNEAIVPEHPVLAFLFLKGGQAQRLSINPGDVVEYRLFKKSPVIITGNMPRKPGGAQAPAVAETLIDPQELAPSAYRPTVREPEDSPIK